MLILVLNCGSSSVKYDLYNWETQKSITKGNIERIGDKNGFNNHQEAISDLLHSLVNGKNKVISDLSEITAVGHRVVHGGDKFSTSVKIDEHVLNTIKEVAALAPLHNPPNITGIEAAMALLPSVPQVAVFDTAFHQTIPEHAYLYPVPYNWYEDHGVRKYGFHGSSHLYVSKIAAKMLNKRIEECNLITLHIGNGVSFTAIQNGVSIDTSMGLTPLEGAMMGTRCGDIDPAIVEFMSEKLDLSAKEIIRILNKKSGHLGITEEYTDRRDIEKAMQTGNKRAKLSLEMEAYRIKKYIGSYVAALGRVDAIIFTAGVGENDSYIRHKACEGLEHMGIMLDYVKNQQIKSKDGDTVLSNPESKINIFMIPTNEEAVLVEDVVSILEGTYDFHMKYTYIFE